MRACFVWIYVMGSVVTALSPDNEWTDEQKLLYHLQENYDPAVRPVFNASHPVVVRLGITLAHILDVDEKNQVITLNVWLDQEWYDERLKWDKHLFSNISILRIPCDLLWLPDIILYNSVDDHNKGYMRSLTMVQDDGNVFWPPIVRMRSSCKMDITYFPFDEQVCQLKLGSWAYDGFQIDVIKRTMEIDINNYVDNGEWILIDTLIKRHIVFYQCCPEPYPDLTFYIHIRRRVLFYTFNVIVPCVLLCSLSLTGFMLPSDSGEKVTLGLTVLLAFSVFMLLVAENMPPTSEYVPLIGIYLTVVMAMSAISVALAVFVLNCHHRGTVLKMPPIWMQAVISFLARSLCLKLFFIDTKDVSRKCSKQQQKLTELLNNEGNFKKDRSTVQDNGLTGSTDRGGDIMTCLTVLMSAYERSVYEQKIVLQWREIARVVDRLLFVLFLCITLVSSLILLVVRPLSKRASLSDIA